MKNIIKIEGEEYIKMSKYKALEKKKLPKEKVIIKKTDMEEFALLDPSNVCGIFPLLKRNCGNIDEIDTEKFGYYKEYKTDRIKYYGSFNSNAEVFEINGTRYSKEYLDSCCNMANVWFDDKPRVFMKYDQKKEEWVKNQPIMFLFGENMLFVLAPRIDSEDCE